MLTCRETSELVSQSIDRRLSWRERLGVRLHLLICAACTEFHRQVAFLHAAAREYARRGIAAARQARLSDDARDRIRKALRGNAAD